MPAEHSTSDATTTDSHAGARTRPHRTAVALLALGAPFVAAAPAAAQGGAAEQAPNGQGAAPGSGHAAGDASSGQAPTSPAPPVAADTGVHGAGSADGAANPQPASSPSAQAGAGADVQTSGNTGTQTGHGGTQAGGTGTAQASADAGTDGPPDNAAAQIGGNSSVHAGGNAEADARGNAEASAEADAEAEADAGGNAEADAGGNAEAQVNGSSRNQAGDGARTDREHVEARGAGEPTAENDDGTGDGRAPTGGTRGDGRTGGRGFTDVRVTAPDGPGSGRVTARVKASPDLDAAIRAEARATARDEIRARFGSPGNGSGAALRLAVRDNVTSSDRRVVRVRQPGTAENAAAMLQMLETAWKRGGPASANALLDLWCNRETPVARAAFVLALHERATIGARAAAAGSANAVNLTQGAKQGSGALVVTGGGPRQGNARGRVSIGGEGVGVGGEAPAEQAPPSPATPHGQADAAPQPAPGGGANAQVAPAIGTLPAVAPAAPPSASPVPAPAIELDERPAESRGGGGSPQESTTQPGGLPGTSPPTAVSHRASAQSQRQLAFTGADLPLIAFLGAAALAAGTLLRRRNGLLVR
jgi:nicotinate-nucleotide--dimethylbenzimidazole phosphoribosyltransferase